MRRPELLLRKLTIDPIPLLPFPCSNIEATLGPGERDERAAVHHVDRRHRRRAPCLLGRWQRPRDRGS